MQRAYLSKTSEIIVDVPDFISTWLFIDVNKDNLVEVKC